jgi:4-amino-4-deoxy-L-arabinose transferase-like glycosyltransferase
LLPRFAAGPVLGLAAAATALLLLVSTRYGYHRDELYFLEASRHLAWGYVDQPPGSVAMAWLSRTLFGGSLPGLRLFPAIADGVLVALAGLTARELGGRRFPQTLAALAVAVGPFLAAAHLAGPTVYDILAWAAVSLLVIRILRTGRERLWVAVGAICGVALLNKETILFLLFGLAIGLLTTGRADIVRSRWLWLGIAVAVAIWLPTLVWQAIHGWPTVEMSGNLRREHSGLGDTLTFVPLQLLLPGWYVAPVWLAGLWALWREERFRAYRAFAVAYGVLFVLIGVLIGDRPYYVLALYVVLLAAGAIVTEGVVEGTRRFFSTRSPGRRLIWRSPRTAIAFVAVFGVLGLPVSLPVLPASMSGNLQLQTINYDLGETVGWPELVSTVARVYRSLPASERSSAVILTSNYGEAGAIDRYGPALGLPQAYSGHNTFWWWGPPLPSESTTITVGFDPSDLAPDLAACTPAARVHNADGMDNDEEGAPVMICRHQRAPWPAMWPAFRHYD